VQFGSDWQWTADRGKIPIMRTEAAAAAWRLVRGSAAGGAPPLGASLSHLSEALLPCQPVSSTQPLK